MKKMLCSYVHMRQEIHRGPCSDRTGYRLRNSVIVVEHCQRSNGVSLVGIAPRREHDCALNR
jgi:hypothetical protein